MTSSTFTFIARLPIALMCTLFAARPAFAGGDETGRIRGFVKEPASGTPMAAITVKATSPALIGTGRTTLTKDDGTFELESLPPGKYLVEVSYVGFSTAKRQIVVRQGETAALTIEYSMESAAVESVVIIEKNLSLTRPDSAHSGTVLNSDSLDRFATGRSYQSVATQVAGVNPESGGGEAQSGTAIIKGGLSQHNRYLVDGMDLTDPVNGTISVSLAFDSIESIQVLTSGTDAEQNALGGVIDTVSMGGSDKTHVKASLLVSHQDFSAPGAFGINLYEKRQPFGEVELAPDRSFEANLGVGGPILKQKLWYNVSYQFRYGENAVIPGPPLVDIQHPAKRTLTHLARAKLTYSPNAQHVFHLSGNQHQNVNNNVNGGNRILGIGEEYDERTGFFVTANWEYFISRSVSTKLKIGYLDFFRENGSQGLLGDIDTSGCQKYSIHCKYDPYLSRHTNADDRTQWYQSGTYRLDKKRRIQVDPSVSLRFDAFGHHDVKLGFQVEFGDRSRNRWLPTGASYSDSGGGPGEAGLCEPELGKTAGCNLRTLDPGAYQGENGWAAGFFVRDRWWTPWRRLTVLPGIRFDYGVTNGQPVFGRDEFEFSRFFGIGPRLGFALDIAGDAKTVLSAHYGRANEVMSMLGVSNYDYEFRVQEDQRWNRALNGGAGGWEARNTIGGADGVRIGKNLEPPRSEEVTASLRREVASGSAVSVDYTYRRVSNYYASVEVNQIWDPTGSRVVGYVDGKPHTVKETQTPDSNYRLYHGVDLVFEGRPTPRWDFYAAYTLSWLYGPGITSFSQQSDLIQYDKPRNNRVFEGFNPGDTRHHIKVRTSYALGRLSLGGIFQFRSGEPFNKLFYNNQTGGYTDIRSPYGTVPSAPNDVTKISEAREPDRIDLDLRIMFNVLPFAKEHKLFLIADIFNLISTRAPTSLVTQNSADFGQVSNRQGPVRFELAMQYVY